MTPDDSVRCLLCDEPRLRGRTTRAGEALAEKWDIPEDATLCLSCDGLAHEFDADEVSI